MSGGVLPGWYPDPAAPETQRYWDGEQWVGAALPVEVPDPPTPPPAVATPAFPATAPAGQPSAPGTADYARLPFPAAHTGHGDAPRGPQTDERIQAAPPEVGYLAPVGLRLVARLIDIAAVAVLCIVVNSYFFVSYYREVSPQFDAFVRALQQGKPMPQITESAEAKRLSVIMVVTAIALWFAYEVPGTANTGQTLGKRLLGIRVVRLGGQPLTFWTSTRRWFVLGLPALLLQACGLPLQMIDCAWCTWDKPLRQCLHDKGPQTVVVMAADRRGSVNPPMTNHPAPGDVAGPANKDAGPND
jgi:uncharacterized RDD family membrane protein YckC